MEVITDKKINIEEWLPIDKIFNNGIIKTKDRKYIKIIKVYPINYNLKTDLEKKSILNSYKIFLKTCNFDIQILIQSNKEDLSKHILKIKENIKNTKNKNLEKISIDYIKYIEKINLSKKSSSKSFYLIIQNEMKKIENNKKYNIEIIKNDLQEKYFKIKECLLRCGNLVTEISDIDECNKIIYSFINTRKYLNNM